MSIRDLASPELIKQAEEFTEAIKSGAIINPHRTIYRRDFMPSEAINKITATIKRYPRYNAVVWYLRQLLPLTYVSEYTVNVQKGKGLRQVCVWKMWFGKCYNIRKWVVAEGVKAK